ncbi:MAG: lipocalin [Ignavibacteriae bacterium]|nr:lipocalin [Ignavibacteriota bacterium]NOG99169.1 lipocalin [Ignavibacteriota bacterium]
MRKKYIALLTLFIAGCLGMPEGITPINNFELEKYLGKWYEIARLDHSFERGLDSVSAQYSMRDDGGLKVINRGFNTEDNEWSESEGKAYFVNDEDEGYLKVSFFGPFYGSYVIFELDKENYQHAFVSGNTTSYLWLLSRTPTVDEEVMDKFLNRSRELGFNTEELIFVNQ